MFNDSMLLMYPLFICQCHLYRQQFTSVGCRYLFLFSFFWRGRVRWQILAWSAKWNGVTADPRVCWMKESGITALKWPLFLKKKKNKTWGTALVKTLRWANGSQPAELLLKNKREMMKVGTIANLSRVSTACSEQQSIFVWGFTLFFFFLPNCYQAHVW